MGEQGVRGETERKGYIYAQEIERDSETERDERGGRVGGGEGVLKLSFRIRQCLCMRNW